MPERDGPALDSAQLGLIMDTPLFRGLAETDVKALLSGAEIRGVDAEAVLYCQGDLVDCFHVVLAGHVELTLEAWGHCSVIEVARAGSILGDAAMFGGGRFLMSARGLTQATVLSIPADSFLTKLGARFDIIAHMLSTLSSGLRGQVRQIAELKLKSTAQRLGSFLLSMADAPSGRVVVSFPYDKKLVASQLGMKPETLSRSLVKLAAAGVASMPDNAVVIADLNRLREFCTEDGVG